jgi:hypothetical protein
MSSRFIQKNKKVWGDRPTKLLEDYNYQPDLTKKLDSLNASDLNRNTIYEIVLWKINRFPCVPDAVLEKLKHLGELKPKKHAEARAVLEQLLKCNGIALPMASTILRFINPSVFQIIDDRAYRVLFDREAKYPTKPVKITDKYINTSIDIYFKYLNELHRICSEKLPFEFADRILYKLDIQLGNKIGDK